jgi:hypothetical protein
LDLKEIKKVQYWITIEAGFCWAVIDKDFFKELAFQWGPGD